MSCRELLRCLKNRSLRKMRISYFLLITLTLFAATFGYYKEDCFSDDYFYYVNKESPEINISVVPGVEKLYVKNATFYAGSNKNNLSLVEIFGSEYFSSHNYPLELEFGDTQTYSFRVTLSPYAVGYFKLNIVDSGGELFNGYIGDRLNFYIRYNDTPPSIVNYVNGETIPVIGANEPSLTFQFSKPVSYYNIEIKPVNENDFETVEVFNNEEICVDNIKRSATLVTSTLKDNIYDLKITYTDLYGNTNTSYFTIYRESTPLKLYLISNRDNKNLSYFFSNELPNFSDFFNATIYSRKNYINLTLRTNKPSECYFADYLLSFQSAVDILGSSTPTKFHSTNGLFHWLVISVPEDGKKFEVFCRSLKTGEVVYLNDLYGRPSQLLTLKKYDGNLDYVDYFPKDLISTKSFTIFAETTKKSICGYSIGGEDMGFLTTDDFIKHTSTYSLGKGEYNFTLLCVNEVGETITKKNLLKVDPNSLIGIIDYSPKVVGSTPAEISVLFNGQPDVCKFSDNDVDVSDFSSLTNLLKDTDNPSRKVFEYNFAAEGMNDIYILCNESGFVSKGSIQVFYDKTGPVGNGMYFLSDDEKTDYVNDLNDFRVGYNFTSLLEIDHYVIDILDSSNKIVKEFTTGSDSYRVIGDFKGANRIRVTAVDSFGKNGSLSKEIKQDNVSPMIVISFDGKAVKIVCTDDKSGCKEVRYGLSEVPNIGCMPIKKYNFSKANSIYVSDEITFVCVEAYDYAGNKAFATKVIRTVLGGNESANVLVNGSSDDLDGDGIPNDWEDKYGLNKLDPSDAELDYDGDELSNFEEYKLGTNPQEYDTDGDSYGDGYEVQQDTDPLDPSDYPGLEGQDNNQSSITNNSEHYITKPYSYNQTLVPATSSGNEGFSYTLLVALVAVLSLLAGGGYYSYRKGYLDKYLKRLNLSGSSKPFSESGKSLYNPVLRDSKVEKHIEKVRNFVKKREDEISKIVNEISKGTSAGNINKSKRVKPKKKGDDLIYDMSEEALGAKMEDIAKEAEKFEEFYKKKKGDSDNI